MYSKFQFSLLHAELGPVKYFKDRSVESTYLKWRERGDYDDNTLTGGGGGGAVMGT